MSRVEYTPPSVHVTQLYTGTAAHSLLTISHTWGRHPGINWLGSKHVKFNIYDHIKLHP